MSNDFLTLKYDFRGNLLWAGNYSYPHSDVANAISLDNYGNIFVTGYSQLASSNYSIVTIKFSQLTGIS